MTPILSIAIPTYNKKNKVLELVNSILTLETEEIEVAITDNASTDGTFDALKSIDDKRLRIYLNPANIGSMKNIEKSIFNCSGHFAFILLDRDFICAERLINLLEFLKDNMDLAYLYCNKRHAFEAKRILFFSPGYESLMGMDPMTHPTGMVFNVDVLKTNSSVGEYYSYVPYFCNIDIMAIDQVSVAGTTGSCIYYDDMLYSTARVDYYLKERSASNIVMKDEDFVCHPKQLFIQFGYCIDRAFNKVDMTENEKCEMVWNMSYFFYNRFFAWRRWKCSPGATYHYKLKYEYVNTWVFWRHCIEYWNKVHQKLLDDYGNKYNLDIHKKYIVLNTIYENNAFQKRRMLNILVEIKHTIEQKFMGEGKKIQIPSRDYWLSKFR